MLPHVSLFLYGVLCNHYIDSFSHFGGKKKRSTHCPKRSYKILLPRTHFLGACQKFLQDHRVPTALSWVSGFFIRPVSKHLSMQLSATNAPLPKAKHQSTEEVIWKDTGHEAGAHGCQRAELSVLPWRDPDQISAASCLPEQQHFLAATTFLPTHTTSSLYFPSQSGTASWEAAKFLIILKLSTCVITLLDWGKGEFCTKLI